jgi:hypothetical protein
MKIYLNGTIMEEETMEMTNNPSLQIENSISKGNEKKIKQIHLLPEEIWKKTTTISVAKDKIIVVINTCNYNPIVTLDKWQKTTNHKNSMWHV